LGTQEQFSSDPKLKEEMPLLLLYCMESFLIKIFLLGGDAN